jgi:hypothetical protein
LRAQARRNRCFEWRNVDLEAAILTVSQSTVPLQHTGETKSSRTPTIAMPAFVAAELRELRLVTAERLLGLGDRLSRDHQFVAHEDGRPSTRWSLWHGAGATSASCMGSGISMPASCSGLA